MISSRCFVEGILINSPEHLGILGTMLKHIDGHLTMTELSLTERFWEKRGINILRLRRANNLHLLSPVSQSTPYIMV